MLPDVRGYGRSICADPACHTWDQYTDDVIALLDELGVDRVDLGGTGLGSTVTLRTALAHPDRVRAAVLISVEDIEDDQDKERETAFLDAFAEQVRTDGIEAAWAPVLGMFPPVIAAMVRDAIPRSDPASIVAAASIGRDRAFRTIDDLAAVTVPTLIIPGSDPRHPTLLGDALSRTLPKGVLAPVTVSSDLHTADDLAAAIAPAIRDFLA